MEPDDSIVSLLILAALILAGGFFSMSEVAILSLNDSKIRKMAEEGNRNAERLVRLIDAPSRFLATIQLGITFCGFCAAGVAANTYSGRMTHWIQVMGLSRSLAGVLALLAVVLLLVFVTLVFSELVPKRIGMHYSQTVALAVAKPLSILASLERPFVFLLSTSTNAVLRILGIDLESRIEQVTEEEIRMMIDAGNESGSIEENEKDMINNIFEFDDRTAIEMMAHRTEIAAISVDSPLDEVVRVALETGYSRIPVYEDDLDSIVGILYVKDLLHFLTEPQTFVLRNHMREPLFVLESVTGKTLLEQFQQKKVQLAIVIDEYGGTSGLVTMEDVLESIVGNIQDEYDDEKEEIKELGGGLYELDGLADLEDVAKLLGLPEDEEAQDEEFETIGGYIVHHLGYIPGEEESPTVRVGDVLFKVLAMDERRIARLRAEVLEPEPEIEEPEARGLRPFKHSTSS